MSEAGDARSEFEDFLEDILGFNFRSFRTLRDLLIRPNTVFKAYAARDRVTYTPSLRLWLGLITLQLLLSIVWGGYGGMFVSQLNTQPENAAVIENALGTNLEDLAEPYSEAASFLHPILVGGFTAFSAFLIGAFNKSLSWAARLNITFGILTAASLVGLILLLGIVVTGATGAMTWMIVPVALMYWIVFTFGAPGVLAETRSGAIIKGAVFSLTTIILVMIGGLVMSLTALMFAIAAVS
ncbi:DUF3667 domain-containing protein [Hyphobacterium marinum]|uniref:DUF3667 domain-containing protein n=1 Tax=Hyphobacterium marinum TaxID=3116574 RepID=A0ABU7M0D4_9PROT|nr:DUF3667 domain-containing protein [Hyphobacterium sp. Y6023]MEE2567277.1 DUF3667 domain-containing protein [Hyphobacterium sp. Y6023]